MGVLAMKRGDDRSIALAIVQADGETPQPLTGMTLTFTGRRFATPHADAELVKTIGSGITVTDEAGGLATVAIDAADTADMTELTVLRWDVELSNGAAVRTVADGLLYVRPDETR